MSAILGRKVGMTSIYNEAGTQTVVTVIEAGPCVVTQVKTDDTDGYSAVQIGYTDKKAKHTTKALQGHFAKADTAPKRHLVEFRDYGLDVELGQTLSVADIFTEGEKVAVSATSKGKGFQGVVKRHGFPASATRRTASTTGSAPRARSARRPARAASSRASRWPAGPAASA